MDIRHRERRWLAQHPGADRCARSLAFLSALCIVALSFACGPKQPAENQDAPAIPVRTAVMQPVSISDVSEYLAALKSRHSLVLDPQVEGQVTNIFVKSGDRVTAGTPLIQIDPLKQQAIVGSQEAGRAAQVANVQFAQTQWERAKKLYESGVTSKQDFDQAKTNLDTAQQQLKSLDAQVLQQQVELHYYHVVAPADGIVGDIPVRVGDRVTTTTTLTTVDEPGTLELYVNIPVERSNNLKRGKTVQLLDTAGNLLSESRIDFISPEIDNNTQSVLVKAQVKNSSGTLRPSQFVRARIIWGTRDGLQIPVLAVSRINGQFFVFVVQGSGKSLIAHQKMLRLGEMTGDQYVVLDGLQAGDRVVVEGAQTLVDGASVSETTNDSHGKPPS
jgi:RND family efflux transporter MFP subunit